jgi:hypothetical protein
MGLLDAEEDGPAWQFPVFEMEHVMNKGDVNAAPVLTYLFHRIEQRLTGRPTLIVIEEAWLMLTHGLFAEKLEEWLRVLRKANAAVVFVTQSLAEVFRSRGAISARAARRGSSSRIPVPAATRPASSPVIGQPTRSRSSPGRFPRHYYYASHSGDGSSIWAPVRSHQLLPAHRAARNRSTPVR